MELVIVVGDLLQSRLLPAPIKRIPHLKSTRVAAAN